MRTLSKVFIVSFGLAFMMACGDTNSSSCTENLPATPTYTTHIKSIITQHCIECHSMTKTGAARNSAPIGSDYDTYTLTVREAVESDQRIRDVANPMPPVGTTQISACDVELFRRWVAAGTPENLN